VLALSTVELRFAGASFLDLTRAEDVDDRIVMDVQAGVQFTVRFIEIAKY
jgi:hypothetical protein